MKKQLTEIAGWLQAEGQHMEGVVVSGVSIDSRTIKVGDLFIPFRGEQVNGHKYVEGAIEKGAVASLWMKDEPNPPKDIPLIFVADPAIALQEMARTYRGMLTCKVIGITGSNGKTSTKDLVASVLSPYFNVRKTEGNFNNELGLPLTILSLNEKTEFAVLEMGMSSFGEISFLSKLAKPDYVVITNIGEAHMQDLGSREGIAQAKLEIIDGLATNGQLFYDGDEVLLRKLLNQVEHVQSIPFGVGADNTLSHGTIEFIGNGSRFKTVGLIDAEFMIPVYGSHQVKNTLAAILIAYESGLSVKDIQVALKKASLTDMRMQPVQGAKGELFINDAYNAAPTSMAAALDFIRETKLRSEKWLVLGDMLELGDGEQAYHEELANQIMPMDLKGVLLYGKCMKWLYDELQKRGYSEILVWSEDNYTPIIDMLQTSTNNNSVILLKGSRSIALENVLEGLISKETR
ncbi:UDP-N-acetylmuramoyl-tripeptide--D-alanyl-D-alanine ligase [Sporosarcina sp. G11-34]|uniref:UDP-N-acetylmuramoyl-tripeptide--D-alanyl-D- alanine ligase n=1 Tax=Sporosarcina sp. G11-34 TaxID=2849605 RepID=UPI0022A9E01B|nr:UDP-N-acetylmuramoyl-tripeptide--D-alanyl-D-alanine ligase [Sporosarcina sp. G11-34]MCZ2260410.1 UDP-N-acetylmuramoyl-tripeptide--D-alanyl-D-alanine ligase [Sporosarcina sp. G11-34]